MLGEAGEEWRAKRFNVVLGRWMPLLVVSVNVQMRDAAGGMRLHRGEALMRDAMLVSQHAFSLQRDNQRCTCSEPRYWPCRGAIGPHFDLSRLFSAALANV